MGSERVRHDWATNSFTFMADLQCGLVSAYIRVTRLYYMHIPFHILFRYGLSQDTECASCFICQDLAAHPSHIEQLASAPAKLQSVPPASPLPLGTTSLFCVRGRYSDDQPFLARLHTQSLSRVQLFCDPMNAHQAPLSMEFPRQEYWSGLTFPPPGDLPDPGIRPVSPVSPVSPALQADSLLLSHRGSNEFSKLIQTEHPQSDKGQP